MDRRLQDLAGRMKGVLDAVEAGRQQAEEERERELAAAREARRKLLEDLQAFGRAVGHLVVEARDGRLSLRWGSQRLDFVPEGDGDRVAVRFGALTLNEETEVEPDIDIRIFRHPDAGNAWVLSVARDGEEEVEPLFEAGLVHLLTEGLGIPDPPAPPPRPQPPLDDLVPGKA